MTEPTQQEYSRLTARAVKELIAPHTWVAAIAPVFVGGSLTIGLGVYTPFTFTWKAILAFFLMLLIAILSQSAVNSLNDYVDFVKGTDSVENCVDTTDASIIYNNLNPKAARNVALACILVAVAAGVGVVLLSSWMLLIPGLIGVGALVLYSAGPKPISYLPLGELVSGGVMGIIITCVTYYAMVGAWNWWVLLFTIPPFITIALIMQVNNTCDIERDKEAGRRTLPVLLGMRRSGHMIGTLLAFVLLFMTVLCGWLWPYGVGAVIVAYVLGFKRIQNLYTLEYNAETRPFAMGTIVQMAIILNLCYVLMILIGAHFNA